MVRNTTLEPIREAFLADQTLPVRGACGAVVRTATVSCGQAMPEPEVRRSRKRTGPPW